jgi:streptomycin 6-kinase
LVKLRSRFAGGTGPLPAELVDRAEAIYRDLLSSMGPVVLLHGDFHLDNILRAQRAPWIAIDPQGVAGEAEYEVGALLRNPPKGADRARALGRRLDQLAEELGFSRERLRLWGLAQAVLAAWWGVEDHDSVWEGAIECAEVLARV